MARCINLCVFKIIVLSAVLGACDTSSIPQGGIRTSCPAPSDQAFFFPPTEDDRTAARALAGFSGYLSFAKEQSLSCGASEAETYRLLYIAGESWHVIRLAADARIVTLIIVKGEIKDVTEAMLKGEIHNQGAGVERSEKSLERSQWDALVSKIESAGFWTEPGGVNETLDSAALFEGRRGDRYRMVTYVGLGPDTNNVRSTLVPAFMEFAR